MKLIISTSNQFVSFHAAQEGSHYIINIVKKPFCTKEKKYQRNNQRRHLRKVMNRQRSRKRTSYAGHLKTSGQPFIK